MSQRFESLDGLRGLLAMLVMLGHLGLNSASERFGVRFHYELAVDFFFVLSGFVLTATSFFGRKRLLPFLVARLFRLWPLHAITATWILCLTPGGSSYAYLLNLLLLNNVGLQPYEFTLNFPSWSVSVELWISIAVFVSATRLRPNHMIALGGCAIAAIAASPSIQQGGAHNIDSDLINSGLLRGLCGFISGVMAYRIFEIVRNRCYVAPRALGPCVLILATSLMLQWREFPGPLVSLFYLLTPLTVVLYALRESPMLSSRWVVELGRLSYAIYLLHIPMLYSFENFLGRDGARGIGAKLTLIAAVLIAAKLTHHMLELPLMDLGRRIGRLLENTKPQLAIR
jgi:peptidoglycan/LPS O-acetylase OafA/YrhL